MKVLMVSPVFPYPLDVRGAEVVREFLGIIWYERSNDSIYLPSDSLPRSGSRRSIQRSSHETDWLFPLILYLFQLERVAVGEDIFLEIRKDLH